MSLALSSVTKTVIQISILLRSKNNKNSKENKWEKEKRDLKRKEEKRKEIFSIKNHYL
jgi:hypothetical protein